MTVNAKNKAQTSVGLAVLQTAHAKMVFGRRVRVLAECLSARIPQRALVLDIGCGDGTIASLLAKPGSEISIEGVEFAPVRNAGFRAARSMEPSCRLPTARSTYACLLTCYTTRTMPRLCCAKRAA